MPVHYFAYGANMVAPHMRAWCDEPVRRGVAVLPGHALFVMRPGYLSVRPEPGATVHGVVWELDPADLERLDVYEGVPDGLYRRQAAVVLQGADAAAATLYVGTRAESGRPVPGYLPPIVAAARAAGFPTAYIAALERFES